MTALARRRAIVQVASLQTSRTPHRLFDAGDEAVAELVDDVVSIMDDEVVAGRFRELKIKALTDDPAAIEPLIALLTAHGAMARRLEQGTERARTRGVGWSGHPRARAGHTRRTPRATPCAPIWSPTPGGGS